MCKDEKNNNSWLRVANVVWHLIDRLFSIEATFHSGNSFIIESGKLEEKLQKQKLYSPISEHGLKHFLNTRERGAALHEHRVAINNDSGKLRQHSTDLGQQMLEYH